MGCAMSWMVLRYVAKGEYARPNVELRMMPKGHRNSCRQRGMAGLEVASETDRRIVWRGGSKPPLGDEIGLALLRVT